MDVKEVKEKKAELESFISTAIFRYENETGCKVGGIHIMPFRTIGGDPTPQIIVLDVEVF